MNYLDEGYYYRVYELDENRVFKKFQPYWFSFRKIFAYNRKHGQTFFKALIGAHKARLREANALKSIKEKLKEIPTALFANPAFADNLDYSQDKVAIVDDLLAKNDFEQNKKIIDQYIEFQKILWSYGMHDKTYKLQPNYGVDKNGQLVCIDFGEFAFTKEEALKNIQGKKRLARNTYKNWSDQPLKDYYTRCMEEVMKEEVLNQCWGSLSINNLNLYGKLYFLQNRKRGN